MIQKRWTLHVTGRVQGVYYRAHTQKTATELGLTGYAHNRDDGSVEVVAEGAPDTLNELYRWCQQGPPAARVDEVRMAESRATGEFSDFSIRR